MTGILHLIPAGVLACQHHGSYKDVISRVQWFQNHTLEYRQIEIHDDVVQFDDLPVADAVRGILIEYTHFPKIAAYLRRRYPTALHAVRAHNIEPLQHFHANGWWPRRGPVWMLYGMARRLQQDILCKRHCDVIYSINSYENRVYWNRLPGRARVEWLPYFCPDHLIPASQTPVEHRTKIACLPGDFRSPWNRDMVVRFIRLAEVMTAAGAPFQFVMTNVESDSSVPKSPAVTALGAVADLQSFLGELRAVAVLSPLGCGLKTTIVDALAAGAMVLAHPTIVKHCPVQIAQGLLPVDTGKSLNRTRIRELIELLKCPSSHVEVQSQLRARCIEMLQRDFGPEAADSQTVRNLSLSLGTNQISV